MLSDATGAYSGKIFCCAPLVRDPRGLFWQNLLLRPADPRSPGLIPTKSLAATRCPDITGAHFDKISCCDPLPRYRRGLFRQNLLLRPAAPISPGLILAKSLATPRCPDIVRAYLDKISCCAPLVRDRRGLFRQNLLLSPTDTKVNGYNRPGFVSHALIRNFFRVQIA